MASSDRWVMAQFIIIVLLPCQVEPIFPLEQLAGFLVKILHGFLGPHLLHTSDPTILMNAGETIQYYGYPFENHTVVTMDGYILELHRIPHGKNSTSPLYKEPIIMITGLCTDSGVYLASGEEKGVGFAFANAGYDVWLHNNRGSRYTRKHVSLLPDEQKEFWDFSFHEMGIYDLPAAIDHILSITKAKQVYLMGHSMGGTIISIMLAEQPLYEEKVKAAFLMAPAVYLGHIKWPLRTYSRFIVEALLQVSDNMDFLPYGQNIETLAIFFTTDYKPLVKFLMRFIWGMTDYTIENILKVNGEKLSSGANVKTVRHLLQIIDRNDFVKYDYGPEKNMKQYNQMFPPQYFLGRTKVPVTITYGNSDTIVVPGDIARLSKEFTNLIRLTQVTDDKFTHFDFIISDAMTEVYDTILADMAWMNEETTLTQIAT